MQEDYDFENFKQLWLDSLDERTSKNAIGYEKWIAKNILKDMDPEFDATLMRSPKQNSKVDVEYKNIKFQIKRIRPEWVEPTKIDRDLMSKIKNTNNYTEILKTLALPARNYPIEITQEDTLNKLQKQIEITANKISKKTGELIYSLDVRRQLDLHFYFLNDGSDGYPPISNAQINSFDFDSFGWRTISYQINNQLGILIVSENSPSLIKEYK